jgi:hypothetical protein
VSDDEQVYGDERARALEATLVGLARQLLALEAEGRLLGQAGDLLRLLGDVRSELFHYMVRCTYDTPEIADHRRIVADAVTGEAADWGAGDWHPDDEDDAT